MKKRNQLDAKDLYCSRPLANDILLYMYESDGTVDYYVYYLWYDKELI